MIGFLNFTTRLASPELIRIGVIDVSDDISNLIKSLINFKGDVTENEIFVRTARIADLAVELSDEYECRNFVIYGSVFFMPALAKAFSDRGLTPYTILLEKMISHENGKVKTQYHQKGLIRCFP